MIPRAPMIVFAAWMALLPPLASQTAATPQPTPLAASLGPRVEIRGTIERVQLVPGQGTPFLEVKTERGLSRVMVGSMRYLMEKNFNPKAGAQVVVQGFEGAAEIQAITVSLPDEKVFLRLRDEQGVPLWRMGRYGKKGK